MPPAQIIQSLESLRRKAKGLSVLFGLAVVILAACALATLGGVSDYLLHLPGIPRLIGLLGAIGLVAWLGWRYVVQPLRARLSINDVAGRVEEVYPQFEDRLRSSVQFLGDGGSLSSDPLRRRAVEQAGDIARSVDFDDVLVRRPTLLASTGAVFAVVALALIAVLLGDLAGIVAGRLFDPLNPAHQWPKTYEIAPLDLDDRVPAGRQVQVNMTLARGEAAGVEPVLFYQLDDGPLRRLLMTRQSDDSFTAAVDTRLSDDAARGELQVWIEAGDDESQPQNISVLPQLALTGVTAQVTPPAYVPNPTPQAHDLLNGAIVTATGSQVAVRFNFSKPLAPEVEAGGPPTVQLTPAEGGTLPEVTWSRPDDRSAVASFQANETTRFWLMATDIDGFETQLPQALEVVVRPDQSPTIQLEEPRRNENRTPQSVVPLVGIADDDYGFESITLIARRLADEDPFVREIPLFADGQWAEGVTADPVGDAGDAGGRQRVRLRLDWDLATLAEGQARPLESGDVVEYFLRAKDTYALDGEYHEPAESGKLRITIISQDELSQEIVRDLRDIKDQVSAVKQAQDRTTRETTEAADQTKDKPELDEADRAALERLSRDQAGTAATTSRLGSRVAELSQRLAENRSEAEDLKELTDRVEQSLERTAEGPMKQASAGISQAGAGESPPERRNEQLDEAGEAQNQASERLDAVMREMDEIGSLRSAIDQLQGLLERQKKLGEASATEARDSRGQRRDQMSPEDRQAADRLADEQEKLADDTGQALQRLDKTAQEMQQSDASTATAMKEASERGKQAQVPQKQQQAADSQRQNQQGDAERARQQAQIGLEMVLNELKEAERQKLQELQKKLAQLQEQVERLIRRQAKHNLDNRDLAGVELDPAAAEELNTLASIEGEDPVTPTLPRLSQGQEQTERNTRSVSRDGELIPSGGEIVTQLTRAASRMERAAVFLRDEQLVEAYEPPQAEALAALRQALAAVAEQKEQVDQAIEDQQRETIRQRLIELRDEQVGQVNSPTSEIQSAIDADEFGRQQLILRNKLPGRQDQVGAGLDALNEDLAAVGGVAFVYAGTQIKGVMDDVSARLAEPDTGAAVQRRQRRVVAGLDAMIGSLKVQPREERFEKRSQGGDQGGGQGGGQGPTLPPEAELRLIRQLQQAVNDATVELAEEADGDAAAIEKLGGEIDSVARQQGDLRDVLDKMLQQYSQGKIKLGAEPDPADLLPEETGAAGDVEGAVEDGELLDDLLGENAARQGDEGDASRIGDRMARSRQRLELNDDVGEVTQTIQQRIVVDIEALIEQARQQQQQQQSSSSSQQPQQGEQQRRQQQAQGEQQANTQGQAQGSQADQAGAEPGAADQRPPVGEAELSGDLKESLAEWGTLTPRQRAAVIESMDEQALDSYRRLIDDYYRALNRMRSGDSGSEQP